MPSTYSSRLRLNFQAPGDNLNTWGAVLNTGSAQLLEDAISKRVAFSLSGPKTLTTANGADDEARCVYLDVTSGSGGAITVPSVEKLYVVRNGASGDVIVTTGGMTTATLKPGEVGWVVCDGATVRRVQLTDFGGARITGLGAPVTGTDAATKTYADSLAFNSVDLPGQGPGTVGLYIRSDGSAASWQSVDVTEVTGAAPSNAPVITGGMTFSGSTKYNVTAVPLLDIDLASADFFTKGISANSVVTFSNATASKGQGFVLELTISSAAVLTWPASVRWAGGVVPTLPNGVHMLGFVTFDGGTTWRGVVGGAAFA